MEDSRPNDREEKNELPFEWRKLPVDERLQQQSWNAIEAVITREAEGAGVSVGQQPSTPVPVRRLPRIRSWVAAASILLLIAGIGYVVSRTGKPSFDELHSGYGEIKQILLPDSSVVLLNGNSSIRIPQQWKEEGERQVWLEGEAYFQVKRTAVARQKFVVHTRQVDVEVLGTRFNVNTRRERSIVALEEGKVRISFHGADQSILEKKAPVIMRPGQVAVVDATLQEKINEEKDVKAHSGWSRNEFHFDNTPLSEVARMIEDTYGYRMEVSDTSLYHRSISGGDLRAANVQELVKVLEFTLKLSMRIRGKTIYVSYY